MEWFKGGVGEAIAEAKRTKSVFVVVVKGGEDDEATKSLNSLLEDPEIFSRLSGMVCIELENGSPMCAQFSAIYPVILIPSIYFIDSNTGVDLEILGAIITKETILSSIDKVSEKSGSINTPSDASVSESVPDSIGEAPSEMSGSLSTEALAPNRSDTQATTSLEERVKKAKALAAQRQAEREEAEKNKEKSAETERRQLGKEMSELKVGRG